jgi:hypothetical protein
MKNFFSIIAIIAVVCLAGTGCNGNVCRPGGSDNEVQANLCPGDVDVPAGLIGPDNLVYLGAFRLPLATGVSPQNYGWGGKAMTYYPDGDPSSSDSLSGSLFIAGNDSEDLWARIRACYVAETSIPEPSRSRTMSELPVAGLLQDFVDLRGDGLYGPTIFFELPKQGLQFLAAAPPLAQDTLYMNWGQHIENEYAPADCTGLSDPSCVPPLAGRLLGVGGSLAAGVNQGPWWVDNASLYSINDYLFEIPSAWADAHVGGRRLAAGRFRDGGQGSQGPVIVAVGPWLEGNPPAKNSILSSVTLLHYASFGDNSRRLSGYQHADEWAGGAWLEAGGRAGIVFVGAKAVGQRCWYGWQRCPCDQMPCVEPEDIGGPGCFNADGTPCKLTNYYYCRCTERGCDSDCVGERGWWTERWEGQMLFYDPADLARVAAGEIEPSEPQPYACMSIENRLFLNTPAGAEGGMGTGGQRRYRIGAVAYDRGSNLLYVTEQFADLDGGDQPVVHVWQVQE